MGRRQLTAALLGSLLAVLVLSTGSASAARVLVLEPGGHVRTVNNPFLTGGTQNPLTAPTGPVLSTTSTPLAVAADTKTTKTTKTATKKKPQVTVVTVLAGQLAHHEITAAERRTYLNDWNSALNEEKHLSKARSAQLAAVTVMIHDMAASGALWPSRLPVVFLTLERNAQWWKSGAMLSYGERVQFAGSELEWEYYTGEGIQLQVLGTFGEANGYYESGSANYPKLTSLMSEMIPLAVTRAGGLAWEYYFDWEGGKPPWVSAMAQATGLEALTNAYKATGNTAYLTDAHDALPLFSKPPPAGVGVKTYLGMRYLQYSFAPSDDIINAFLQTLIGLDDYATASSDPTAEQLFDQGTIQAQAELPEFNTGAWSLYQPGEEDDLSYHQLVTGFLQTLCSLTKTPIYCTTGQAFEADLHTPPVLKLETTSAKSKQGFSLRFTLSKISRVGVELSGGGKTYLYTSAQFPHGTDAFTAPALKAGTYAVKLSATDLAGNYSSITGSVTVS
jgi:hypothetical protein